MRKRVAVVDGFYLARLLPGRLSEAGVEAVHVASRERPEPDAPGVPLEEYVADIGVAHDLAETVNKLKALGVSRVIAGAETGVALAARLGEVIGSEHDDPDLAGVSIDKVALAEAARAGGINVPRAVVVASADEAVKWMHEQELDEVVVKPVASAASDGVRICRDAQAVSAAVGRILESLDVYHVPNERVLVQERIRGREFAVNTVSVAGVHEVISVWEYEKQVDAGGIPAYRTSTWVDRGDDRWRLVADFTRSLLDVLGIRASPAHTEVIITSEGVPVLVETCARLAGGSDPDIDLDVLGISQLDAFVDAVANGALTQTVPERCAYNHVTRVHLVNHCPGIANDSWVKRLRSLPTCRGLIVEVEPGDVLGVTDTLLTTPGEAYLADDSRDLIEIDHEAIRRLESNGLYTRDD